MGFKLKKKKNFLSRFKTFDKIDVLSEAIDLFNEKRWKEAFEAAEKAVKTYPNERRFWEIIAVSGSHLGEYSALQRAYGKLIAFDANDENAWFGLAQAYAFSGRIALAVKTYKQFLEKFPDDSKATNARDFLKIGEKELERIFADFDLPNNEEGLNLACLAEKAQVLMKQGNYEQSIKKSEEVINKKPDFVAAYNNLSLTYFMDDQPEKAVETARKVLDIQPHNFHALGNLAKFAFFLGRREDAQNYANLLESTKSDNPMIYAKKIETFAFLGDDELVVKVYKDWQKQKVELPESEGFFRHLAAFSFHQLGKENNARKIWKQAVDENDEDFAKDNFEEMHLAPHDRNVFSLPLRYWISGKFFKEFASAITKIANGSDKNLTGKIQQFFKQNPNVLGLLSNVLERADLSGKEFVITLIEWSEMPEALEMLKNFALGQRGSDDIRYQAAMSLAQNNYISNKVKLWREGELREIILLCFEVTSEPIEIEGYPMKPKTLQFLGKGINAMHNKKFELAKQYYEMALNIQPNHPSLLYNLMTVKYLNDEEIDLQAELESLVTRFPTYSFAALTLALQKIQDGKIEEAKALAERFHDQKVWHVTEITLWCRFNMELLIEKEDYDAAKMWFDLLKKFDTQNDHSTLEDYFERALLYGKLSKMLKKINERSAKRKKKK